MSPFEVERPEGTPAVPDEITPLFLTQALQKAGCLEDGIVSGVDVLNRINAGMTAQIARLGLSYKGHSLGAPHTVIVKLSSAAPELRSLLNWIGMYQREVLFYRLCADKLPFRVPVCYAGAFDASTGMSLLILEDLDGFQNGDRIPGWSAELAERLVRMMARMHATWWQDPSLEGFDWLYRFDSPVGLAISQTGAERWPALCALFDGKRPQGIDEITARLRGSYPEALKRFHGPPHTLVHGDYHPNNVYIHPASPDDEPVIADFQMVMKARGPFDLGYFLGFCMDTAMRRANEAQLLDAYYTTLLENGVTDYTKHDLVDDYCFGFLETLLRLAYIAGMSPPSDQKGDTTGIRCLSAAVEDHEAWKLIEG